MTLLGRAFLIIFICIIGLSLFLLALFLTWQHAQGPLVWLKILLIFTLGIVLDRTLGPLIVKRLLDVT